MLKVYVIRGRNLAAKDKSGTSDPYLSVTLGPSKQTTPTISKTLNPEWKVCFDMPLLGVPLIECTCWDKDTFGKDYMGEFDIAVEDLFVNGAVQTEPRWYPLISKRKQSGKKSEVSGEIQMQFQLLSSANPAATPDEIRQRFRQIISTEYADEGDSLSRQTSSLDQDDDDDAQSVDETEIDTASDTNAAADKKKKRKKLAVLRRKSIAARAYEFTGADSGVAGIVFMEVVKVTDLPPQKNMTKTSFDMDAFVTVALGRKVLRTKVVRHSLNPVYNEKMVFQVMKHEQTYLLTLTVIDQDQLTGNDFIASAAVPISKLMENVPELDPTTGLYLLPDIREYSVPPPAQSKSRFRIPLSRSSSQQNMKAQAVAAAAADTNGGSQSDSLRSSSNNTLSTASLKREDSAEADRGTDDLAMQPHVVPLELKDTTKWADTQSKLFMRSRYMPYNALRQQFWRAMLKQYDADDSGRISKIELITMLDTLGSTLHESTVNGFFARFASQDRDPEEQDLSFDQAVICLEEQLLKSGKKKSFSSKLKDGMQSFHATSSVQNGESPDSRSPVAENDTRLATNTDDDRAAVPSLSIKDHGAAGEEGQIINADSLTDDGNSDEEHVIAIRECPICHQPKLNKRTDADIVTHIATCASSDWRTVNNLVMGGFVTQSQAQRKWYSKVINKVSYGGYKLGANSANILVQDRITGQINEERMSVYVRLGIRLLYKALGSREMEKKRIKKMLRSLSIKQGKKYDDPASAAQIEAFVNFHNLNLNEVALPISEFKSFNEFFYRALKPDARPCSAPDRPEIVVSPADARATVFNTIDDATRIWVKGRDFTIEKLLGNAYPEEAKRYKGGSMGIFRLAPQDYHRFHVPVDGVLGQPKAIAGEYYTVNPMAIRSALDVYGENVRVCVPIDSVAHGKVMFVCIGAMMVGSTVITRKAGERVKRAEELGYFKFGGSTVLLFVEPGKMVYDDDLIENSNGALETLVRLLSGPSARLY